MSPLQLTIMLNKVIKLRKNKAAKRVESMGLHIRTVSRRMPSGDKSIEGAAASGATAAACGDLPAHWAELGVTSPRPLLQSPLRVSCLLSPWAKPSKLHAENFHLA